MQRALAALVATAAATGAACRLDPLVKDDPGASVAILPADAVIPNVTVNGELTNQITLNDSLDSKALAASGNLIARNTMGVAANGDGVKYWSFGVVNRAPSPMYVFGTGDPMTSFVQNSHLPLVDAVPGDVEYSPFHAIYRVRVTDKYQGEKFTTTAALADALELGLIEPPVAIKSFINSPIVRPGTRLETSMTGSATPMTVYARGYIVDSYQLGGTLGVQPNPNGLLPTSQVSFLRGPGDGVYNQARPIFQASIPTAAPQATANYTALSVVINVDLNASANSITKDSDLFTRNAMGAIIATKTEVVAFNITTTQLDLQIQFAEGSP